MLEGILGVAFIFSTAVAVGGMYLAYWLAGMFISGESNDIQAPEYNNYPIQTAMKGGPIIKVYGTDRVAGNVVVLGTLHPYTIRHDTGGGGGGKGGDSSEDDGGDITETRYKRSFLLAICEGPAVILRAWKGKKQISLSDFTWFDGDNNTGIRALTGKTYGDWPNLCCAWFDEYKLGNSEVVPNFTFEVSSGAISYPELQIADGVFQVRTTAPALTHSIAISNTTDLQNIKYNLSGNYYLINDIDASATSGWNGGLGFDPIDNFVGTLDGCGYTVSDLTIDRPSENVIGLFGAIDAGSTSDVIIKDLTLESVDFTGKNYAVAGLVGEVGNSSSKKLYIYNCHTSGELKVEGTGGISNGMGGMIAVISTNGNCFCYDCTSSCNIDTTGTADVMDQIGGFTGTCSGANGSDFYNCRASGILTGKTAGNDSIFGGFIGDCDAGAIFQDCSATGDVSAEGYVGGFCGIAIKGDFTRCSARGNAISGDGGTGGFVGNTYGTDCTWTDCYAWGDATDSNESNSAGGFIGDTNANTSFTNCYSKGIPAGYEDPVWGQEGGFIGWDFGGSSVYSNCFWDTESSGMDSDGHDGGAVGHITSWMKTKANYEAAGWDFDDVWQMDDKVDTDMNPADIIRDIVEDTRYGAGRTTVIDDTSLDACGVTWDAMNFRLSIKLDSQRPWLDWVDYILAHVGGARFKSQGKLHFGVLQDEAAVDAIGADDFVRKGTAPAVDITKRPRNDTFNRLVVGFVNRDKRYEMDYVDAEDRVDQRRWGVREKIVKLKGIHNRAQAKKMANRLLIDAMYRFNIYKFKLTFNKLLLDKFDCVTLTDGELLAGERVRIMNIDEDVNCRDRVITAMDDLAVHYPDVADYESGENLHTPDAPVTLTDAAVYFREDVLSNKIFLSVVPSSEYFNGAYIYFSYDDVTYSVIGRCGVDGVTSGDANSAGTVSSGSLPAHGSMTWAPDESILVDIGTVTDLRTDVTEDEFWHDRYLAKIGDEIIAFKSAEETAVPGIWQISNLRRGLFGTEAVSHSAAEVFCTLYPDLTYSYSPSDIGQTLYFKAVVYYGGNNQDISDVSGFPVTLEGHYQRPAAASLLRLTADASDGGSGQYSGSSFTLYWNNPEQNSLWDILEDGQPMDDTVEDDRLQSITLKFEETDGTPISQREIAVAEQATITKATDLGGYDNAIIRVIPRIVYGSRLENPLEVTAV